MTKLFRPGLRQHTMEHTRLHDLLRQGCTLPLTLVVAPAGWGESTLVAKWLARDGIAAGWVSLDGGDNDPVRFWRYLLLAADQAGSAASAADPSRLRSTLSLPSPSCRRKEARRLWLTCRDTGGRCGVQCPDCGFYGRVGR